MANFELGNVVAQLTSSLGRPVDLTDGVNAAQALDHHLQIQVLQNYREQLEGLEPDDSVAWLLHRMAEIEARVLALQSWIGKLSIEEPASDLPIIQTPKDVTILFDDDLVQVGFYATEKDGTSQPFRWIGPSPVASVFVPLMQAPLEVRIDVAQAFVREEISNVKVSLDGGPLAPVQVETKGNRYTLVARPEIGPISHSGLLRLDIDAVRTESPESRGEADKRKLGLAILSVTLTSLYD